MEKSKKPSNPVCYTPSSGPFRIYVKITIYKNIILPVVLRGCEIWSLILREEHRPRVFDDRLLIRIFEPKTDEVTEIWRKLHNEELHKL
jgi:hypothetical protein